MTLSPERILEHLPTAILVYRLEDPTSDHSLRLVSANPAAAALAAIGPAAVPGKTLDETFPALREAGVPPILASVARSGEPASVEDVRFGGPDDAPAVFSLKAFPLGEGQVGLALDGTAALKREHAKALAQANRVFTEILDHVPSIVFVKRVDDLQYVYWNKACAESTGVPRERVIGNCDRDIWPENSTEDHNDADRQAIEAGVPVEIQEHRVRRANGEVLVYHTLKVLIRDDDGRPLYLLGVSQDISERRQTEEQLEKSRDELQDTRLQLLETIREISTPVLPIHDGVLVVPLVGHLDSQRSAQFTESLLASIQRFRAQTVILDITGVQMVDTAVANHLIQSTRAASLLGAECVLVGIAPQIARTMVQIGVELGSIITRRDLQAGVSYALEQQRLRAELQDEEEDGE